MSNYKIQQLQKLLVQAGEITIRTSSDAKFITWKNNCERTIARTYGEESLEIQQFKKLRFFYQPFITYSGSNYSNEHRRAFDRDFEIATGLITSCINDLEDEADGLSISEDIRAVKKVFISHSSNDIEFVEVVIDFLELFGLPADRIFCTSFEGYGVPLGADFLDRIRDELQDDVLVLFMLSKDFYASPVCLCEMGAAWVQTKNHIPILIPPMDFSEIKGVIPHTQGFKINQPLKLNSFKERVEELFALEPNLTVHAWERKRDKAVAQLNDVITKARDSEQ